MPDLIDDYQHALVDLTDRAEDRISDIYAANSAGTLSDDEAVTLLAALVDATARQAAGLAEVSAGALLTRLAAADTLPLGIVPRTSTSTVAALRDAVAAREGVTTLAKTMRAAVYNTASDAWQEHLQARAPKAKWTRRPEAGTKCPVCTGLANGRELLVTTPMHRHTGCRCVQQPVSMTGEERTNE
ncbi:hypothetical protein GCM10009785_33650 [Brooklawnia cerclae]|uniref:MuF-like minor capsid protein n=1 Tax=Brooklawnia cerclae TaxID=349934 RepID=A0ABX0SGK9_9ACTN|nr:hypothetical protein [Brooklawnia cerclae]NIH55721.1 hypothetical protein [Brooklawnia cerclae]